MTSLIDRLKPLMSYFKCGRPLFGVLLLPMAMGITPLSLGAQEVPFGIGEWDPDSLGNHRAVVRVYVNSDAVRVRIPWRRRDRGPERKRLIILDAISWAICGLAWGRLRPARIMPGMICCGCGSRASHMMALCSTLCLQSMYYSVDRRSHYP